MPRTSLYRGSLYRGSTDCILFFRYDPRELDVVLREVVIMNSRAEMYLKFIEKRISVRTFYVEYFKKKSPFIPSPLPLVQNYVPFTAFNFVVQGEEIFQTIPERASRKTMRISC